MKACDLLLKGATVFDGSGQGRFRADVALSQGRIAAVGQLQSMTAAQSIELDGLALAPGFIDVHTHDDRLLLADPAMVPKVSQGVTTVVVGNCGISLAPLGQHEAVPPLNLVAEAPAPGLSQRFDSFASYFAQLAANPAAVNMAALIGHTTLRVVALADLGRPANAQEITHMQSLVREGLSAGALGVSTGTYYAPAAAATASEIRAVCEPLRASNALIASHLRDEGDQVLQAMTEAIDIAQDLGVRQLLSHHKVLGRANFGRSRETLALLDQVKSRSDVCLDCYPYAASSTVLRADAAAQASRTLVAWSKALPEASGRYLDELASERQLGMEAMIAALQPAGAIYFSMDEADVERILAYPDTMIGSDGLPHDTFPHPRLWGAFPRVLGHFARERGLFSLEQAIHKMSGLPASRLRMQGRGLIQAGFAADLVVFDPLRVADQATFASPLKPAIGIERVYVNGSLAYHAGQATTARAGQIIRRAGVGVQP
ncbi:MAG: N-acyl-D-amino-acid deacylase family protein [Hylemonella sp.]